MHTGIAYQELEHSLLALLPSGEVRFLHPAAKDAIDRYNCEDGETPPVLDDFILSAPLVNLSNFHLPAPAIAFIEVTNGCNLRCQHCYAESALPRKGEMSTDRIRELLDEFGEMGVLQVFLTGGEVFMRRDAVELIAHARSKRFSTQIFSNGLLIKEEHLRAIPAGQSFFISFDSASPERTIRGKMDFPTLRRLFDNMAKYGHVFRPAISVHRSNLQDVEEIFEWCAENGFPRPQWLETHPIGRALASKDILLSPEHLDEAFEIYVRCMDRFQGDETTQSPAELVGSERPQIVGVQTVKFCQQIEHATQEEKCGRTVAYVASNGDVYPCTNCMSNKMYKAGNVTYGGFKPIWDNGFDTFRAIKHNDHRYCGSCPVNKNGVWCQFRCPPLATNVSGDEKGCGATDYVRQFMLKSHAYWELRKQQGKTLRLLAQR